MIKITNLTKKYNIGTPSEQVILDNCYFNASKGEKIIIVGENGAGKTTFLKIIGLLDKNFSGNYFINGIDISTMSTSEIARLRNEIFGFAFQEYNLLEEETAYENILIPLLYSKKYRKKEREKRINEISEILEIENVLKQKIKFLSGGERQRITIARAIINDPEVILLDEPTNAINHKMKIKIFNYIESLVESRKILILVTHELFAVEKNKYSYYELINYQLIKKY